MWSIKNVSYKSKIKVYLLTDNFVCRKRLEQMNKDNVGAIILTLRTKLGISQIELCKGLCTNRTLSRIELGERLPDKLLLDAILQRLGKSPDKLETILTEKEYMLYCQRRAIETDIINYDFDSAKEKLEEYRRSKECKDTLQRQYISKIDAVLADEAEHNVEKSICILREAAEMTMPHWETEEKIKVFLGTEEAQILLLLAQNYLDTKRMKKAYEILEKLFIYLETRYSDEEEKVKVYPKCAYLLVTILWEKCAYKKAMKICEKAIDLLTKNGVIYHLPELMQIYILGLEKQGNDELANKIRIQRESLLEVYEEYGVALNNRNSNILLVNVQHELYLCNEIIRDERINRGETQEQLSENICSPETLSRIESGKRAPSRRNFNAIMSKLGIDKTIYNSYVSAKDFSIYEEKRNISKFIARHEYKEARKAFDELLKKMDSNVIENKQYILSTGAILDRTLGIITNEEALKENNKALSCTFKDYKSGLYRTLSRQETVILNQIAIIYKHLGKRKKAISILENALKCYENSKIDVMYHYSACSMLMINLSSYLEEELELDKAIKICDKGINLDLKCGRGNRLGIFLANKTSSLEHILFANDCKKYLQQAFYLSDLMQNYADREDIKRYYEKNYDPNMKWY